MASSDRVAPEKQASSEGHAAAPLMAKGYRVLAKQGRTLNAAQARLAPYSEFAEFELGFTAILIAPQRLPRHLLAAFDAST